MFILLVITKNNGDANNNSFAKSLLELRTNHTPVATSFIEIYPGGGGFRCLQFKYVNHNPDLVLHPSPHPQTIKDYYKELEDEIDLVGYLNAEECFIFGIQDGYSGPMISYYGRIDHWLRIV